MGFTWGLRTGIYLRNREKQGELRRIMVRIVLSLGLYPRGWEGPDILDVS